MSITAGFEHIVREQEPLGPYTWLGIGGQAEFFAEPTSVDELARLVKRCREQEVPVRILGGGSNLLVPDQGVEGMTILLSAPAFGEIRVSGQSVTAGGGAKLGHVISTAVREGLAGLEALVGIPGTIGGALRGNVDAGGGDLGQWTSAATVMTHDGEILPRYRDDLRFAYRQSNLDELVILDGTFDLEAGDPVELTKRLQKQWIVKKAASPQGNHHVGYIFKDKGGVSAAEMIEQAGLRSVEEGKVQLSERNANFLVVGAGASSADVLNLIELLRSGVAERLGVELETQIEVW